MKTTIVVRWLRRLAGGILRTARMLEGNPHPMHVKHEPSSGSLHVGSFLLVRGDGVFWLEHAEGEGVAIPHGLAVKAIRDLFDEVY